MSDPYYIGYYPRAPKEIARRIRVAVVLMVVIAAGVAIGLTTNQSFDQARFDFGSPVQFDGILRSFPAPHLVRSDGSVVLLVAFGKLSLDTAGLDGRVVVLDGTPIERGPTLMAEVVPGSIDDRGPAASVEPEVERGSEQLLYGEIVGSKCYLGVMNPGRGTTHRACARMCILGGIPPVLHMRDSNGTEYHRLLVGLEPAQSASWAGLPVAIRVVPASNGRLAWLEVVDGDVSVVPRTLNVH